MQKIVIAGSASLQEKVLQWKKYWEEQGATVLAYPNSIPKDSFINDYPKVFTDFFKSITETDTLFIMNENKNGLKGYIGAETFAEMCFAVVQNQIFNKKIEIILLQIPDEKVQSFMEVNLWLQLGWIKIMDK